MGTAPFGRAVRRRRTARPPPGGRDDAGAAAHRAARPAAVRRDDDLARDRDAHRAAPRPGAGVPVGARVPARRPDAPRALGSDRAARRAHGPRVRAGAHTSARDLGGHGVRRRGGAGSLLHGGRLDRRQRHGNRRGGPAVRGRTSDGPALVARTQHLEYHRWLARLAPTGIAAATALGWLSDGPLQGVGTLVATFSVWEGRPLDGVCARRRAELVAPGAARRARPRRRRRPTRRSGHPCAPPGRTCCPGRRGARWRRPWACGPIAMAGRLMRLGLSGAKALPEDSIALRVVVAPGGRGRAVAVISQGVVADRTAFLALALAPAGYVLSYRRRGRPERPREGALAAGLLLALSRFLGQMGSVASADAARAPLAALFVWVQVLHAFDVPRRRDLAFSMVSSTTLIAVGGALALSTSYLGHPACVGSTRRRVAVAVVATTRGRPHRSARYRCATRERIARARSRRVARWSAAALAALVLAVAMFSVLPRIPSTMVRALPFRMAPGAAAAPTGDHVENPALPPPAERRIGRGLLVERLPGVQRRDGPACARRVVRRHRVPGSRAVRLPVACGGVRHLRRLDLDTLDLAADPLDSNDARRLRRGGPRPGHGRRQHARADVLHRADAAQRAVRGGRAPHRLFPCRWAAQRPRRVDPLADLPGQGLVYSVESTVPTATPAQLRSLGPVPRPSDAVPSSGCCSCPTTLPQRVRDLAGRITAGAPSEYDAVMAVQAWLQTNTRYDLTVPREPDGVDAVDQFLFVTRRGFCEHIAAAMAVLLAGRRHPDAHRHRVRPGSATRSPGTTRCATPTRTRGSRCTTRDTAGCPTTRPSGCRRRPTRGARRSEPISCVGGRPGRASGSRRAFGAGRRRCRRVVSVVRGVAVAWPVALLLVSVGGMLVWLAAAPPRRDGTTRRDRPAYEDLWVALAAAGHPPDPSEDAVGGAGRGPRRWLAGRRGGGSREPGARHVRAGAVRASGRSTRRRWTSMRALAAATRVRELTRHR